jgi:uncharacterized protein YcaQ
LRAVKPASLPTLSISADEARRLTLRAQGLLGAQPRTGRPAARVAGLLRTVGAVQLDTISVLARSHELVAYARLGAVGREAVETAYWRSGGAFEYWAHAACVLPIEEWPWFEVKRRHWHAKLSAQRAAGAAAARTEVLARLADLGPVTTAQLGGAKGGGAWWDWSPLKIAVEQLLGSGEVVCTERRGWRRVYDLAERAVPAKLRAHQATDEECWSRLSALAAQCIGVGTIADIAEYFRLGQQHARVGIEAAGLVKVNVEGWTQPAYVYPGVLDTPADRTPRGRHRTTLLSPFDSLIWDRRRTARIFDFQHRLEAYVPATQRVHGYFTMPLLAGGRLRGRVDPARAGKTLVARRLSLEPGAVEAMTRALVEAATWVGCNTVVVENVSPASLARPLRKALDAAS